MNKINIKKLPKSEVEMEGEIEADIFEKYFDKAVKKIGENIELDGFRKGKVPNSVLLSKIPEIQILEEMAEMALAEKYPKIIEENKIQAISRPEISITKIARKNPLGFKIKTAVLPELILPDYKKISKETIQGLTEEEKNTEVTEKEIEDTILDIRKSRAPKIHMTDVSSEAETKEGTVKEETHLHDENCKHEAPMPEGVGIPTESIEEKAPESPAPQSLGDVGELPEWNEEFVKTLGPFKNIADFRDKLKENIKMEKENQVKERTRLKIVEKIIAETKTEVPDVLIDLELDKIIYSMESDISAMGIKFEEYLKHINKTPEDLRKDFRADAEKKAKLALVLNKISENENIKADPEQVAKEVAMILEHYKDADPERANLHAENVLTNEAVFKFLESQ